MCAQLICSVCVCVRAWDVLFSSRYVAFCLKYMCFRLSKWWNASCGSSHKALFLFFPCPTRLWCSARAPIWLIFQRQPCSSHDRSAHSPPAVREKVPPNLPFVLRNTVHFNRIYVSELHTLKPVQDCLVFRVNTIPDYFLNDISIKFIKSAFLKGIVHKKKWILSLITRLITVIMFWVNCAFNISSYCLLLHQHIWMH